MKTKLLKAGVNAARIPLSLLTILTGFLWPEQATFQDGACFDYIVIGSGAGSVVANRLTENENVSVLLIEAGDIPSVSSMLAGLFVELQNSEEDWQYKSEEEFASQSQSEKVFKIANGKVLGGTSTINHLIYLRASPQDFDIWTNITNDPIWSYKEVLPYYKKSETLDDKEILESEYNEFHSTKGPIVITRELHEETKKYLEAFEEIGKQTILDLSGFNATGYTQPLVNIGYSKNVNESDSLDLSDLDSNTNINVRQSLAQCYMREIRNRKNLHVSYNTLAIKINFDENKHAVSVDIIKDGKKMTVKAAIEVILCAGVFNSPQLLMLSGIGPREQLESFNIPVIKDLPVGKNLQDHVAVHLLHKLKASIDVPPIPKLTQIPFSIIVGAVNMHKSSSSAEYQTTNLILPHDLPYLSLACGQVFGYKNSMCDELQSKSKLRNTMYTFVALLQPRSRGEVNLKSADPTVPPSIKESFYSNSKDFEDMVTFVVDFISIANSTYFKEVGAELVLLDFDDCVGDFNDVQYIECYIARASTTLYHYTSTCPMGTVLDSHLRVKGVHKLRVVDASAFPKITTANPLATVVMLAEKASDLIKEDHSNIARFCKDDTDVSTNDSEYNTDLKADVLEIGDHQTFL